MKTCNIQLIINSFTHFSCNQEMAGKAGNKEKALQYDIEIVWGRDNFTVGSSNTPTKPTPLIALVQ